MVLSNKKLKQRLRAELVESVASTVAKSEPKSDAQTQPKSQPPQSLKVLLDSATQRPRLSKREKRREAVSLRGSQGLNGDGGEEGDDETSKKKRKREESGRVLGSEKNGLVSKSEKKDEEMKNPKKKAKRKKKKNDNKKKKGKNEEEKEANDTGKEENKILEANEKNYNSEANQNFDTKVYVGGIPFYSSEDDIRSYFEGCGTITEVDCMTFPESGKFRGIAIICFKTEAAAKRALALNGSDMGGLFLTIVPYKANRTNKTSDFAPKSVEGYYRIYVGNLSWDITEDKLRDFFSDCKITSIRFGNDKETGEFRGYAHVDFSNSLSFTMALKLDQKVVCGRPVVIRCAVPLKKEATNEVKTEPTTVSTLIEIANPSSASKPIEPVVSDALLSSIGAGKTRRRTCYECGEKGHISSDCPENQTASSIPATTTTETTIPSSVSMTIPVPVIIETAETNTGLSSVSAGKLRRRTCYECGEKGHMSSDCPKKQTSSFIPTTTTKETTIPSSVPTTAVSTVSTVIETDDTITGLSSVSAGKLRRRTCYECGEKGHISSDCPKKQNDGLTNSAD